MLKEKDKYTQKLPEIECDDSVWRSIDKTPDVRNRRDVYGELGWNNKFNILPSHYNPKKYTKVREYFDQPKEISTTYKFSNVENPEFFRSHAPSKSVAAHNRIKLGPVHQSLSVKGHKDFFSSDKKSTLEKFDKPFLEKEPASRF